MLPGFDEWSRVEFQKDNPFGSGCHPGLRREALGQGKGRSSEFVYFLLLERLQNKINLSLFLV